jgi:tetratricopeptide (TPR) repeat protein
MKQFYSKYLSHEPIAYNSLALILMILVFYLCHFNPVIYTRLVSEDNWGEYCTALSFAFTAVVMIISLFRQGSWFQKGFFVIIGLISIFVAGEEISWGQRLFQFPSPLLFRQINYQNEFTLHNIEAVRHLHPHTIASYLILAWAFFSVALFFQPQLLRNRVDVTRLPLIPIRLWLFFLLVPYFFLFSPVVKSGEIGELFLGIALAVWAFGLFFEYGRTSRFTSIPALSAIVGMLVLMTFASAIITHFFPGNLKTWLNLMAVRDYPERGMQDQAQQLYQYIFANPHYLTPDTRIYYSRLLLEKGQKEEAFQFLLQAQTELKPLKKSKARFSNNIRRIALIYKLLGQTEKADAKFDRAIKVDRRRLESASTGNRKAEILWSIAMTLEARGEIAAAIEMAKNARANASSQGLYWHIGRWIKTIAKRLDEEPVPVQHHSRKD